MSRAVWTTVSVTAFAGIGYLLIAAVSYAFIIQPEGIAPFWLGSGFSLALLLLNGKSRWSGILFGIFIACMIGNLISAYALATSLGLATANLVAPLAGAVFIQRFFPQAKTFTEIRDVLGFFVAAFLSSAVGAVIGASTVAASFPDAVFPQVWKLWLANDIIGVLIVAPLVLTYASRWIGPIKKSDDDKVKSSEFLLFLFIFIGVCILAFGKQSQKVLSLHTSPYWTLPFLMYSALRFKNGGAFIACLALAIISVGFTVNGLGPYAVEDSLVGEQVLALQFFLGINIASVLLLVGAINQSARKHELLLASEKRLNELIDQSPVGLALCRLDTSIVSINAAFAGIIGYSPEEAVSLSNWDLTPEEYFLRDQEQLELLNRTGRYGPYEKGFRHKDGHLVNVRMNGSLVERGGEKFIWSSIEDISELKEAQHKQEKLSVQLQQTQRMEAIGNLAGGIAHDFNNILGVIFGYTEMARADIQTGTRAYQQLDEVLIAANRAKDLVKQILTFSRQAPVDRIPVKLQPLIKEALKMLRSSLPTTIGIRENIDSDGGTVLADPTQVHQILLNLCTNAYHAMESTGGTLSVSLKTTHIRSESEGLPIHLTPGEYNELIVADTGRGIAPNVIGKIFEPYFTTKEMGKGTGMGLAIIHAIMSEYGGAITVESQLGIGATFHVYFPVVHEAVIPEKTAAEEIQRGNERILFIDDEETLAFLGKDILERSGYRVTVMSSSLQALLTFQSAPEKFDMVITDQTMPDMTGAELASRMLQIRPDIPIILCTGYSNIVDEGSAKAMGIKEFVLKPLSEKMLVTLIRKVFKEGSAVG